MKNVESLLSKLAGSDTRARRASQGNRSLAPPLMMTPPAVLSKSESAEGALGQDQAAVAP